MGMIITLVVLAVIGVYVYVKVIQPMMSGKLGQATTEAYSEYEASKDKILAEYYADPNRFALFKQVITDEPINGIASYAEPKKVGKSITEGLKTSVTGVKKVNIDMFYAVITDTNMHFIEFNGEQSVDHTVYELAEMKNVQAGRVSMKDQMMGVDGGLVRFSFDYKGNEYSYNMYKTMFGAPRFEAVKDSISGSWGQHYLYEAGGTSTKAIMSKEGQIDALIKHGLYTGFKNEVKAKFGANMPE